jgi:hypothetical protein
MQEAEAVVHAGGHCSVLPHISMPHLFVLVMPHSEDTSWPLILITFCIRHLIIICILLCMLLEVLAWPSTQQYTYCYVLLIWIHFLQKQLNNNGCKFMYSTEEDGIDRNM